MSIQLTMGKEHVFFLALPEPSSYLYMRSKPQRTASMCPNPTEQRSRDSEIRSAHVTCLERDLDIEMSFQVPAETIDVLPRPSQNGHSTLE
jgi:hypothetical protein